MATSTVFTLIVTLISLAVAAFVFRAVVLPAAIYSYSYVRYGKKQAEREALESMGENKASYAIKDQMKRTKIVDGNDDTDELQNALGYSIGESVDNAGLLGGLGQGVSDLGDALSQ